MVAVGFRLEQAIAQFDDIFVLAHFAGRPACLRGESIFDENRVLKISLALRSMPARAGFNL
ncbi:hypothetical protein [Variovorax sp. GT1P44]|uniref:hypothetical protein n=1 Tax=Variovorax sp. GT1P44 TaxID=3443742 RepID=UPI003F46A995